MRRATDPQFAGGVLLLVAMGALLFGVALGYALGVTGGGI
jgi:hypothetical protein